MLKSAYAPSGLLALAFVAGIVTIGGPASSEPAIAQGLSPDLTAFVRYRDLDLTTDAGRAKLQQRVRTAARDLCGQSGPGLRPAMNLRCENQAEARAAEIEARVIAEANGRAYAATPADRVAVAAVAKGP
jgi:UrcA family protein